MMFVAYQCVFEKPDLVWWGGVGETVLQLAKSLAEFVAILDAHLKRHRCRTNTMQLQRHYCKGYVWHNVFSQL